VNDFGGEGNLSLFSLRRLAPFLLAVVLAGCASNPGFQSYYVGSNSLQWFVSPVDFENQGNDGAEVDFTYRRVPGQQNKIHVNITWAYSKTPQGIDTVEFRQLGQPPRTLSEIEIFFQDRAKQKIRFSGLMTEDDFLALVRDPHSKLNIKSGTLEAEFASSAVFERTFHDLGVELQ
jgi:hypothetical protein